MNIYAMDCGWRGSIIVVAENEVDARLMMQNCYNYDAQLEVEVLDFVPGVLWLDMGDC